MRPFSNRKLAAGLASAAGAAVLALGSLTAAAAAAPDPGPGGPSYPSSSSDGPQNANIPQVAWVGEHVRLVVCDPVINTDFQVANYQVEDWSGYQFQAPNADGDAGNNLGEYFDPGPAAFFESSEPAHAVLSGDEEETKQEGCVATDYKSLNPGLARIRVVVKDQSTKAIVFSHQFIVIWLTANTPTLSEAGLNSDSTNVFQSQLNGTGQANLANYLGDPAGDGQFHPTPFDSGEETDQGLIQVKVTGSFPVLAGVPLSNILPNPSYTLPSDWATLAEALASTSESTEPPGSADANQWDIHETPSLGDSSNTEETGNSALNADYLRSAFGDFTSGVTATVGPFDPEAANETLLSDGVLNEDDAPMPALRIDVGIAPNSGGSTDISGVGQIAGASKARIYSHDFTGNATEAGNLYAPYYGAYIPATDRPVSEASGITGSSPGGDFPGFINSHPDPYTFWDSVQSRDPRVSSDTGCLRRTYGSTPAVDASPEDDYQTPGGDTIKSFYTDERGEVYVTYSPGDEFYFEHLGITPDSNNGCDLESLYGQPIGTSSITAKAIYPYEPVDYPPLTSEPLVKTVSSLWKKDVYEFPKGTSEADQNIRILVAKAQDISGEPFTDEIVCFHAEQNSGVRPFVGHVTDTEGLLGSAGATVYLSGTSVTDPGDVNSDHLCETTNSQGLAAVEVSNSSFPSVDVLTSFENEGITRDNHFDFSSNGSGTTTTEGTTTTTTTTTTTSTVEAAPTTGTTTTTTPSQTTSTTDSSATSTGTSTSQSQGSSTSSSDSQSSGTPAAAGGVLGSSSTSAPQGTKAHVSSAKLVKSKKHYYLLARISSSKKHEKIRLVLLSSSGKVLRTINVVVATNRNIKIAVPYNSKVASAKLTIQ
jgi:hypothetical protein